MVPNDLSDQDADVPEDVPASSTSAQASKYTAKLQARKAKCQVPGCRQRLSKSKAYYKRYKICSLHSSLPQMVLGGAPVRFCQQCGRFQPLDEFDSDRKSCKAKLATHNERRKRARRTNSTSSRDPASSASDKNADSHTAFPSSELSTGSASPTHPPSSLTSSHSLTERQTALAAGCTGASKLIDELDLDNILDRLAGDPDLQVLLADAPSGTGVVDPGATPCDSWDNDTAAWIADTEMFEDSGEASTELSNGILDLSPSSLMLPDEPQLMVPPAVPAFNHGPRPGTSLASALDMLDFPQDGAAALPLVSTHHVCVTLSLKLFNATPDQLPPAVRAALESVVADGAAYLMCSVRPGCTHLTVDVLLTRVEADALFQAGAKGFMAAVLRSRAAILPPPTFQGPERNMVVQLGDEAVLYDHVGAHSHVTLGPTSALAPSVRGVLPLAMTPAVPQPLLLLGSHIAGSHDAVLCRREGQMPTLEVHCSGNRAELLAAGADSRCSTYRNEVLAAEEWVQFALPCAQEGLHLVEVQKGIVLSRPTPFLVLDDAAAVAEVRQLETNPAGVADVHAFVHSVGLVLEYVKAAAAADAATNPNTGVDVARRVAAVARSLAATCAARGWAALLRRLLPAIALDCSPLVAVEAMQTAHPQEQSLLHSAAASRSVAAVAAVGEWGAQHGLRWECDGVGPRGVTPLHLAALVHDGAAMAAALTPLFRDGAALWYVAEAADGSTPAAFARDSGNAPALHWLAAQPLPPRLAAAIAAAHGSDTADMASGSTFNSMTLVEATGSVLHAPQTVFAGWSKDNAEAGVPEEAKGKESKPPKVAQQDIDDAMIMGMTSDAKGQRPRGTYSPNCMVKQALVLGSVGVAALGLRLLSLLH